VRPQFARQTRFHPYCGSLLRTNLNCNRQCKSRPAERRLTTLAWLQRTSQPNNAPEFPNSSNRWIELKLAPIYSFFVFLRRLLATCCQSMKRPSPKLARSGRYIATAQGRTYFSLEIEPSFSIHLLPEEAFRVSGLSILGRISGYKDTPPCCTNSI
jgi:hypothetical protein